MGPIYRPTTTRRSPLAGLAIVAALLTACTAAQGTLGPSREPGQSPDPGATEWPTTSASVDQPPPSPTSSQASPSTVPTEAIEAARTLLESPAASVDLEVRREKRPADPVETLITFEGRIEPAIERGQVRLDFSGMVAIPGATASPGSDSIVDLVWTPDDLYARSATRPDEAWTSRTRADARTSSGYLGRIPDEVLGLVTLVATTQPDKITALDGAQIDGAEARRWLVHVPVEVAAANGVPADVPNATVLRDSYGIDALDIEVWLIDGTVRRIRYAIAREKALYGGPDRTTVTYDWSVAQGADTIVVPPAP